MTPELTEQQRQAIQEHPDGPVEVVDRANNRLYVLLPREQYNAIVQALPKQAAPQAEAQERPPVQPLRQRLNDLPTPPEVTERARQRCKELGLIFWRRSRLAQEEERFKLEYYYGGQWIGYIQTKEGKIIVAAGSLDEAFDEQLAYLSPEERVQVHLYPVFRSHDPNNETLILGMS
jgi:hypothetical protein